MSNDRDYVERTLDAPPKVPAEAVAAARAPNTVGWWIAAAVAVAAVLGAIFLLSGVRPSSAQVQTARDQSRAEAKIDDAANGATLAATHAAKSAQAAAISNAHATEAAAQAGASRADATVQNASATEPAPPQS